VGGAGGGAIGAALGGLWGLIEASNLYPAGAKDNSDFNQQLNLLALSESKEVKLYQDFTVSGYVYFSNRYFPKEDEDTGAPQYGTLEVMLVREANGGKDKKDTKADKQGQEEEKVTTQKVDASLIACPEPK
jgi:hypothetical protein